MREESPNGTQLGSVNNARALPMPGFEKKDLRRMDLVIDLDDSSVGVSGSITTPERSETVLGIGADRRAQGLDRHMDSLAVAIIKVIHERWF